MSFTGVLLGPETAAYGFGNGHPFGPDRQDAFWREFSRQGLVEQVRCLPPSTATRDELALFHAPDFVRFVETRCRDGQGFLDGGDTPALGGLYEAATSVVGTTLDAVRRIMRGELRQAFVPIGGLHHSGRAHAAGFCVFNDCGAAIELLRQEYGISRIAYVDIDAHHGDGVFYAYEDDAELLFADLHEDGRFLYPGTGFASETGSGAAAGSKLNLPLPPGADDAAFHAAWAQVENYLVARRPEFIILQCGADSVAGDPLTHMQFSPAAHAHAAARLAALAAEFADGRLLALGGGGYNRANLGAAWSGVVKSLLEHRE